MPAFAHVRTAQGVPHWSLVTPPLDAMKGGPRLMVDHMTEPVPQPQQPSHMRAGDGDRALVSDLLSAAYADGRITREEHDVRVSKAMTAKTFEDLRSLTLDLVPSTNQGRAMGAFSTAGMPSATHGRPDESSDITFAVFGSTKRTGSWRAKCRIFNLTLFGGSEIDFRGATFASDIVSLNIICGFGGVEVTVPPGVNVRNETFALFGGTDVKRIDPAPGAPTVILKGLVLFGGITAKGKKR